MKLKEYPESLRTAYQLGRLPNQQVYKPTSASDLPLILSLTSIPSRLHVVHLTIRSLLSQQPAPQHIVLWLHHSLSNKLPRKLSGLQSERFSIRYGEQSCSHRKLVYALAAFPEHPIVTVDDDLMYRQGFLAALYRDHVAHPGTILGSECRVITYRSGELLPYRQWPWESAGQTNPGTLPIGFGGTLYPPGCLHPDTTNSDLYLKLAPKADDLWFKAMALLQGTAARRASDPVAKPIPIPSSQRVSLGRTNVKEDRNRVQWLQLQEYYGLTVNQSGQHNVVHR